MQPPNEEFFTHSGEARLDIVDCVAIPLAALRDRRRRGSIVTPPMPIAAVLACETCWARVAAHLWWRIMEPRRPLDGLGE
jgi:hypothetical protein